MQDIAFGDIWTVVGPEGKNGVFVTNLGLEESLDGMFDQFVVWFENKERCGL